MFLITIPATADDRSFARVLIPVTTSYLSLPGAFGSVWRTETWIHSIASERVRIAPTPLCVSGDCGFIESFPPDRTLLAESYWGNPHGLLVYVSADHVSEIIFSHRVREISRYPKSGGTDLPVVPESRIHNRPIHLLGIPVEQGLRHSLRIYALPQAVAPRVRVEFYKMPTRTGMDELLATRELVLSESRPEEFQFTPSYAEVSQLLDWIDGAPFGSQLRLKITPLDEARIWAFVSVTHNETHQVTIIAPQ